MFLLNPTGIGNFSICNNLINAGFRRQRYYGGLPAKNTTTIWNSDSSPSNFTQLIGENIAPTGNIDLAINGNISATTVFDDYTYVVQHFVSTASGNGTIIPAPLHFIWFCTWMVAA